VALLRRGRPQDQGKAEEEHAQRKPGGRHRRVPAHPAPCRRGPGAVTRPRACGPVRACGESPRSVGRSGRAGEWLRSVSRIDRAGKRRQSCGPAWSCGRGSCVPRCGGGPARRRDGLEHLVNGNRTRRGEVPLGPGQCEEEAAVPLSRARARRHRRCRRPAIGGPVSGEGKRPRPARRSGGAAGVERPVPDRAQRLDRGLVVRRRHPRVAAGGEPHPAERLQHRDDRGSEDARVEIQPVA